MRKYLWLLSLLLSVGPAMADWTGKDASGATITFKNSNTCSSVVCVPIAQPVDGTGAAFGVTANPFFVSPASGATFPVSTASLPLPTGAATAAGLTTINTTLGTPFQAGGSIGNTTFAVTQSTSPWVISATALPLPTGAATSALQSTGNTSLASILTALGSPFQAGGSIGNTSFAVTQSTAANLNMTCANCSGSGASGTDEGGFTAGSSVFAPGGGFFQTTATSNPLTTGQWGAWQMTANRAGFVNLRGVTGTALGEAAAPLQVSLANTGSNATAIASQLVAGSAIAGKFGIDQTTPGTTNLVSIGTNGTVNPQTIGTWGLSVSTQNTATPTNMALAAGQFNTTPTTITTGNVSALQLDSAGNLLVNIKAGAGSGGTALADQATFTQGTTSETPMGCLFNSSYASGTSGKATVVSCTAAGSVHTTVDNTNSNGSATSANSSPVVIASDQGAVAVKAASGAFASGSIASGALASGSIAAGAVSAGAVVSGAVLSGAYASGSLASGAVVDITNMSGGTGSSVPAKAAYAGAVSSGNLTGIIQADNSAPINVSTATTTQLVALSSGKKIYVTALDVVAGGTGNITFEYGTGTACATGTTVLTGAYPLTAQSGLSKGGGLGPVLVVPAGNALCVLTSAAVQMSGSVAYTQF